jgi:hypothetical protein
MAKRKNRKKKFSYPQEWEQNFCQEFERETDRACVILSAAMLEQALDALLKAYLVPITGKDTLLDDVYSPISSFNAKIDLCHRIGLISAKFCRDLHLIRRIRNDFAHDVSGCNFNNNDVRSRVLEIRRSSHLIDRNPNFRKDFQPGIKGDFEMSVSWMLWYLWAYVQDITSIEEAQEEFGYNATFRERKKKKKSGK